MDSPTPAASDRPVLAPAEVTILRLLLENGDKVVGRESLSRLAGLDAESAHRVDACLVAIRKVLGPDSVVTIRRRGWMLSTTGRPAAETYLESFGR